MTIPSLFWHNLFFMGTSKNVGASVHARAAAPRTVRHKRGRSRLHWIISLLLLCLPAGVKAQQPAVVTFSLDFPGSEPSHYAISVSSNGHSTYDSDGKLSPDSEGDPFHLDFSISPETSRRIFDLAARANYDLEPAPRVARTDRTDLL